MRLNNHNYTFTSVSMIGISLIFWLLNAVPIAAAATTCGATFSWLPSTESTVAGYKIYYGPTSGGPYPYVVDVGKPAPNATDGRVYGTASGLTCGEQDYFVGTAYTADGLESDYSAQVAFIPQASLLAAPVIQMIQAN